MPYPTPNLTTLQQQAINDVQSADITDVSGNTVTGLLQMALMRVLALVQAGFAYLHFKYLDYIALQATPFTATGEWLAGWMALKGVTRIPAAAAIGTAAFTGANGSVIPAGTPITRGDGVQYATTANGTVTSLSVTVGVAASVPGAAATIVPGAACSLNTPIAGISSVGSFVAAITPGADQESDASLRTRGLAVYAAPPLGGASTDYTQWATDVPGVTRAWCLANYNSVSGASTNGVVSVLFMEDVTQAVHGGIPQGGNGVSTSETRNTGSSSPYPLATGDQINVANSIFPLRPVTALVIAAAPAADPLNYTFGQLIPNTPAIQAAVRVAIQDMHTRVATPGGTTRPDGNPGGELYESDWVGAVKSVPGLLAFDITSPTGTLTSAAGTIYTVGTLSIGSTTF